MAVSGHLHKLVFGGTLATTETWSCGFHFLNATTPVDQPDVLESAIEQWMTRPGTWFNSLANLTYIKLNEINPATGEYVDQGNSNTHFVATVISGAGGTGPPHVTMAASTVTANTRGFASKGRWFPPTAVSGSTILSDGRISASNASALATSHAQLLTDINGALDGSLVVFSKIGQVTQEITAVRVGRVVDVQSRRRKNLLEDHQLVPIS